MTKTKGQWRQCMHVGCTRRGKHVVSYEAPKHKEFFGQTHDCCDYHAPRSLTRRIKK